MIESEQEDEIIAALVQSGKSEFFGILINRYQEKMMRYARKFLSNDDDKKDIVQEIFIKAYINIKSFDAKRKFSSWLYRIAHNELVNNLKKKNKSFLPLFDMDTFSPHYYFNNDKVNEKIDRKNTMGLIDKCFDELNTKYKEPIILYYLENLSYKEIADVMLIPVSTVGIRIKRAKKIMKSIFEKKGYKYE
jgi:RNA polymerase sigma-70 factor (ECF subfamily)